MEGTLSFHCKLLFNMLFKMCQVNNANNKLLLD